MDYMKSGNSVHSKKNHKGECFPIHTNWQKSTYVKYVKNSQTTKKELEQDSQKKIIKCVGSVKHIKICSSSLIIRKMETG